MNTLIIGPPGSGKTVAACSGASPTLILDVDGKANEMYILKDRIASGNIVVKPLMNRLIKDRLSERALNPDKPPKKQPEGYVAAVDLLSDIVDKNPDYAIYKTIVLDSLSRLVEHLVRLLIYHRGQGKFGKKKEEGDLNWPSWGSYKANLEEVFNVLCTHMDKDFICTAHLKEITETQTLMEGAHVVEITSVVGRKPLIDGQMRDKLAGYFNEVYFMESKTSGKHPSYQFRTRGTKYDARTSYPLEEFVPADLLSIKKKYGG